MLIEINTDKTIQWNGEQKKIQSTQIAKALERFESNITRIEVHLKDENGDKKGLDDMSCLLEARLEGKQPIAVSSQANSIDLAVLGAIHKMKAAIETIVGRRNNK
ncbi:HPF/RaiA family ribosome-associated protein [Putridiphycobacter roseus]|uniref:HPF/RaiA family ribosome-associated protein n=1 Tax=Putridiphycobacter roseus TaxID=2219161 RepID=A0A2W1N1U1_9FLAO|nr:HPF/RaiA family ribosome-associated protein [Putridiphycobacter roseus]PZE17530.1 HPF/RaiA family ribosome-associated protein [Putridiphycobacter roseus]